MQKREVQSVQKQCRKNERGAALVMVLLISFLLLVAITSLLFEASMHTANVTDATSEVQAYYAAESGIQSVVNVLRRNTVLPDNLRLDTSKPATDPANRIDYIRATRRGTSNLTDPSNGPCGSANPPLDCQFRLSRWMTYGNVNNAFLDRVILGGNPTAYDERTGTAYAITVEDPDNLGGVVRYSTRVKMPVTTEAATCPITVSGSVCLKWAGATAADSATIRYVPAAPSPVDADVSSGIATNINFGKFEISYTGNGADITRRTRFSISVMVTIPFTATKVIRGHIEAGRIGPTSTIWILYDSQNFELLGSTISLAPMPGCGSPDCAIYDPSPGDLLPTPDSYYRVGYRIKPYAPTAADITATAPIEGLAETRVLGSITAPEPIRLVIRSTGFGPHGARKQLEAVIQKNYFNGLGAPSPLTLIGPPCTPVGLCTPPPIGVDGFAPNFVFNPGTSNGLEYSGRDVVQRTFLPPIGLTDDRNVETVMEEIQKRPGDPFNGKVIGVPSNIAEELPFWLQSPQNLDITLKQLKATAQASGRYYAPASILPSYGGGNYGDWDNATGITYIDRDLELADKGGGILVVTGNLTLRGSFDFKGLIIVTGAGGVLRPGGGNGRLEGNMVVAPYDLLALSSCTQSDKTKCFLAPRYDISGAGDSDVLYNSNNVNNGLGALTNFVKGVAEK